MLLLNAYKCNSTTWVHFGNPHQQTVHKNSGTEPFSNQTLAPVLSFDQLVGLNTITLLLVKLEKYGYLWWHSLFAIQKWHDRLCGSLGSVHSV